jgi:hypothetical protein
MWKYLTFVLPVIFLLVHTGVAEAHFFGATRQIDGYQVIFAPYPDVPVAGSNSTLLNFSVLENGSNIFNIHSAVVITQQGSDMPVEQLPYKPYEFSDITIPYVFAEPGNYVVTIQTRVIGDEKYEATPLEASFDLLVENPGSQGMPVEELMLFYVTPASVAIAGIAIYLHSKGKI